MCKVKQSNKNYKYHLNMYGLHDWNYNKLSQLSNCVFYADNIITY